MSLSGKVLVVDDDEATRFYWSIALSKFGIDSEIVKNGREAIEAVLKNAYLLILMDIHMPEMCGAETTKAIRELEAKSNLPESLIVGITNGMVKTYEGMNACFDKPMGMEDVRDLLCQFIPGLPLIEI